MKDRVWTFDQQQGIFYVVVPIRMTVVKIDRGGLLVYAPVAPTSECVRLVEELVEQHGAVKYIILPTISGVEHKVFVGPFARRFPNAQVFVAPSQWSFPLDLPLSWLGFPRGRTYILPEDSSKAPFADQFDYAINGPIDLGPGKFAEVALFDRRSHSLLVTDTVVSVPETAPAIVQQNPYPLLFHAKEEAGEVICDTEANRRKGWQRICLFALYLRPTALETITTLEMIQESLKAPDRSKKAYFGLFPFKWNQDWEQSFEQLRHGGRLLVAPILQNLIFNRSPKETLNWADRVASWDFEWIIPSHFDSPIQATPQQFRQAFAPLEGNNHCPRGKACGHQTVPEKDVQFLRELDQFLTRRNIIPPPQPKV
ncbi:MAG: DUF4336 domain-containing protein [Gomphosphaeria aponina SAG 52.96 = DSM 107014]|uniref:DUF4336 domain-containing protein n=1 Tax=Gomphosphaeria aponina SAG 52.96 = DSM 107014 TaxID=1521640 RepID=A0A941GWW6_9CHRO|nr:DUF4336 domain-containing protein [Gomphosphaeria aponina SAG 52.96 = DSM 107014]